MTSCEGLQYPPHSMAGGHCPWMCVTALLVFKAFRLRPPFSVLSLGVGFPVLNSPSVFRPIAVNAFVLAHIVQSDTPSG